MEMTKEIKVFDRKGNLLDTVKAEDAKVVAYVVGYIRCEQTLVKAVTPNETIHYAYNNTKHDVSGPWCMYPCSEEEFEVASNVIDSILGLMETAPKDDIKALIAYLKDRVKEGM